MKKAIAMLAALTICCTAFTACGSSDSKSNGSASKSSKGAKNKSESSFTLGEDGEEMPVAEKVYKAKKEVLQVERSRIGLTLAIRN